MELISALFRALSKKSTWLLSLKELIIWFCFNLLMFYFFLFTAPIRVYQNIVATLAKNQDKDITKIVTGLSAIFHRDFDSFHIKPLHTIVACLRIRGGSLTISKLKQAFLEKVVLKKDSQSGQLAYPELQQYFTRLMGYSFLKWDKNFDIENHVTVYRDENEVVVTRPVLNQIWQDLMSKPFPKGRSLWEAILVENYVADDEKKNGEEQGENAPDWIVFIRMHHGIGDGFSFEKIVTSLLDSDWVPDFKKPDEKTVIKQNIQNLMMDLRCLFMGPYDFLNRVLRHSEDYHSLHFPATAKSNEYFVVEGNLMRVKEVKKIKQKLGVGFTTVLLAVATGAIRRFLLKNAMPFPELYTTAIPFPSMKKRGDGVCNDFFLAGLDLPIDLDNQQARIAHVQQSLENLKHSSFMRMFDIFLKQLTSFPSPVLRAVTRKSPFSTTYSSIPSPEKALKGGGHLEGCDLIQVNFTHGLSSDSLGLAISSITYAGKLRMTLFVERNLMGGSRKRAEQFVECLSEEYSQLKDFAKI